MKDSNSKDNSLSPELEHDVIINLASSPREKFLQYPFKLPRVSTKHPRKNKYRFQYRNRSPIIDTTSPLHSQKSNLDYNYVCKSIRIFSRSAKIMRALSSNTSSFRHNDIGIRKLLNFDSSASPNENNSFENSSSSIDTDALPSALNSSLTDSTDSNVAAAESIDENQNQTPQNRKHVMRDRTDVKLVQIRSRTSYLMSLLGEEHRERIDKVASHRISAYPFCSYQSVNNGSRRPSYIVTASTPRNLSQEFNQESPDRSHTPENIINIVPESISAIKKSHKKEKLYCHEEQSSTQQMDTSIKNDDLHLRIPTESSGTNVIAETNVTSSESESQKKNRNTKRTLIYNSNEHPIVSPDVTSDFDCDVQQINTSTETDLLESELDDMESDEIQNIDSIHCNSREEDMQANIHLVDNNDKEEDHSKKNVCNEEISRLSLEKKSSSTCNANATNENVIDSPKSNSIISQDANKIVTPENNVNVLKHMLTESIKKSHKKMKHESRRKLFKTKELFQETELAKSEISLEDANHDQDKSQTVDISSTQNFEFTRPSTPENISSSRLLLFNFNSIKKSHKKDKSSKRTCSFVEYHDYHNRSNDSLQSSSCEEEDISEISYRNESPGLTESPGMLPKKKKKPRSMPLLNSTPKIPSTFMSRGHKNVEDEFKIYTPIKKLPILLTVTDYSPTNEMSQETHESAMSNEIDCSRCVTPVSRLKQLRKNKNLALERDNATGFETDISNSEAANLKDENGRSTPINMSTMELLNKIDSIKKSHKKDKHSRNKKLTSEKKRSYIQDSEHVNFTNSDKMLEERIALSLKHTDDYCSGKERSIMREKEEDNNYIDYDNPQPSTSRGRDVNIKNAKSTTISKFLNTPPNSSNAMNFIKILNTTSIKKSHKKERDMNAQTKYIFMSEEQLSDDGSIFDEEERLSFMDTNDNTEITTM